ncbi:hypothetical protein CUMW_248680 [Citrus unshiu]|uniref:Uncharacterized protein n=1 Tax=Citrus unshiu TaxID=55188 RepID=A0A2H5QP79_CITUN|nr:hypothetical protein CUMW_248680 [Citrus unshiu]
MASEPADIVLDLTGEKFRCLTATLIVQFNIFTVPDVLRKLKHLRGDDDPNFKLGWMLPSIARDMILLENQHLLRFKQLESSSGMLRSLRTIPCFDIKFENRVMKMPSLEIGDATETILQNLIAYEQWSQDINLKHVIDYVEFLNRPINSSKDAELLCRRGIIDNFLGDDEWMAKLRHNYFNTPWAIISVLATVVLLLLMLLQALFAVLSYYQQAQRH